MPRPEGENRGGLPPVKINFETHMPVEDLSQAANLAAQKILSRVQLSESDMQNVTQNVTRILAIIDKLYAGKWKDVLSIEALERVTELYERSKLIKPTKLEHASKGSRLKTTYPAVVVAMCEGLDHKYIRADRLGEVCTEAISLVTTGRSLKQQAQSQQNLNKQTAVYLNPSTGRRIHAPTRFQRS